MLRASGLLGIAAAAVALLAPAPAPAADQGAIAHRLAQRLEGAKSDGARAAVLEDVMRALHIGMITPAGRPLVVAPEPRAAGAFQLYDFELRTLAAAYRRGTRTSLSDVARALAGGGVALDADSRPLPAELLGDALADAVRSAATQRRRGRSLLPLLVRELGRRHGYDLSKRPAAEAIRLDPVQAWLVLADVELAVLRDVAPGGGARASAASVAGGCERYDKASEALKKRIDRTLGGKAQAWIAGTAVGMIKEKIVDTIVETYGSKEAAGALVKAKGAAGVAGMAISGLHGMLLAYSVDVREVVDRNEPTHWAHGDAGTGRARVFMVRVTMLDDYGEPAIKCGKLAGVELPEKGPLEGVPVIWADVEGELAPDQGRLACVGFQSLGCMTKTGHDGIARVRFTPRAEILPGVGIAAAETGLLSGTALYQTAFGFEIPGAVGQVIFPKYGATRWTVSSHRPRGYRFELRAEAVCGDACEDPPPGTHGAEVWTASICGEDPWDRPWDGFHLFKWDGEPPRIAESFAPVFHRGAAAPAPQSVGAKVAIELDVSSTPPVARLVSDASGGGRSLTAVIEEDTSCPPVR